MIKNELDRAYSRFIGKAALMMLFAVAILAAGGFITKSYAATDWNTLAVGCNECHGYPPVDGARSGATGQFAGSHNKHAGSGAGQYGNNATGGLWCQDCHVNPNWNTLPHRSGYINVSTSQGQLRFSGSGWGTYSRGSSLLQWNSLQASGTCNGTYCHSRGTGAMNYTGAPANPDQPIASPLWGTIASTTCTYCHGFEPSNAVNGTNPGNGAPWYTNGTPKANSHANHVNSPLSYSCYTCHASTVTSGGAISSVGVHVDRLYEVVGGGTNFNYYYTNSGGTCSNSNCHGTSATLPKWGGGLGSLTCNSCHLSQGADWNTVAANFSVPHQKHTSTTLYGFSCEECHAEAPNATWGTITHAGGKASGTNPGGQAVPASQYVEIRYKDNGALWTTNAPYLASWMTSAPYKYGRLDLNPYSASSWGSASYTAGAGSIADSVNSNITWSTSSSCSNVWCHSNAIPVSRGGGLDAVNWTTNKYQTPVWGGTLSCSGCHKASGDNWNTMTTQPDRLSTSHAKHIASDRYGQDSDFTCNACHSATASNNTTISGYNNHVNGVKDVVFNSTFNPNAWYTTSIDACANTYCHSAGTGGTWNTAGGVVSESRGIAANTSIPWSTVDACNSCHGVNDSGGRTDGMPWYTGGIPKANSHNKHVADNGFACYVCHNNTVDTSNNIIGYNNVHVNKIYNIAAGGSYTIGSYTWATNGGTCSSISCHPAGNAQWGGSGLGCGGCHPYNTGWSSWNNNNGNGMWTTEARGAHQKHIDHLVNVHQVTLTASSDIFGQGAAGAVCGTCHTVNTALHRKVAWTTSRFINFGDGRYISGYGYWNSMNFYFGSSWPTYNGVTNVSSANNAKTCSNVSCHFRETPDWQVH